MNKVQLTHNPEQDQLKRYSWLLVIFWTIVIGVSLYWSLFQIKQGVEKTARTQARDAFHMAVLFRRWNAMQGGVYVPVTENTQPNPYLDVPERDIQTNSGRQLTLMNPAYMTRQIHELQAKEFGLQGHITSLNPIRPANAPDPWESEALRTFENGATEQSAIKDIDGVAYMRLMRPLLTEASCLKCHAVQGYEEGDIRGGISVSVPIAPLWEDIARTQITTITGGYGLLWLLGIIGVKLGADQVSRRIKERKEAEEELAFKGRIVQEANDAMFTTTNDSDFAITSWNRGAEKVYGWKTDEVLGKSSRIFKNEYPNDNREEVLRGIIETRGFEGEVVQTRKDGTQVNIDARLVAQTDEKGDITGWMCVNRDITKRKESEEMIRKSEQNLRRAQEMAHVGSWVWNTATNEMEMSDEMYNILGLNKEEGVPAPDYEGKLVHPDDQERLFETVSTSVQEKKPYALDYHIYRADTGEERYLHAEAEIEEILPSEDLAFYGTVQDITERKRVEETLRENERMLNATSKMGKIGGWEHDLTTGKAVWTQGMYDIVEIPYDQEPPGIDEHLNYYPPEDLNILEKVYDQTVKSGTPFDLELQGYTANKKLIWGRVQGEPVYENGKCVTMRGVFQDITERKQAEETLLESERRLLQAQAIGHVGSWEYDMITKKFWGSDEAKRIYGFEPDAQDFTTEEVESCIPERERVHQALVDLLEHEKEYNLEFEIYPKDRKTKIIISSRAELVKNENGEPVKITGVIQDITKRKLAEEEVKRLNEKLEERIKERTAQLKEAQEALIRKEKLATMGELAGGVAHELRNPLGVLSNAIYYLNITLADTDEKTQEYLGIIDSEIRNAEKIIGDLLGFSRTRLTETTEREEVAVPVLVKQVLSKQPPPQLIEVSTQFKPNLPPIFVNPQQIKQILNNLITNAYQAMPNGGTLTLTAETDGENAMLNVTDTGLGIPPENIDKLFEPLFTTKAKGIGLGLALSRNLAEANGATITVQSSEGEGSTFTLSLPCKGKGHKKET